MGNVGVKKVTGEGRHQERPGLRPHVLSFANALHNSRHLHGVDHGLEMGGLTGLAALDHHSVSRMGGAEGGRVGAISSTNGSCST